MAVNLEAEAGRLPDQAAETRTRKPFAQSRLATFAIYSSIFAFWVLLIFLATGGRHDARWLAGWQEWDARWYEQIWRQGYPAADPRTLVFPPGYPLLVGAISKLFRGAFLTTAIVLNLAAFFAAAVLIAEWFSRKFTLSRYELFVFVLSAPSAYFAFTAYSDLIFMLVLWMLLWFAVERPRRSGAILAVECGLLFVIPWIRLTGYALLSWLLARRAVALAVVVSLGVWLAFNRVIAGSALYFLHAQQLFAMPSGNFLSGLADSLFQLTYSLTKPLITSWLEFGFLPFFYLIALTAAGVWLAKKREDLMALTVLAILAVSYNQSVWRSVVRYDLPLIPVVCVPLLIAATSRSRAVAYFSNAIFYALTLSQFSLQIYFARLFHSGGWAF